MKRFLSAQEYPFQNTQLSEDLKLWDAEAHQWAFRGKRAKLMLGASSADIRLKKCVKF